MLATRRFALAASLCLGLSACGGGGGYSGGTPNSDPYGWNAVTAVKITDTTVGTGTQADATKFVTVNYTGYIYDVRVASTKGTVFDTTTGKSPAQFQIGVGKLIPGFDQGVTGMKVGGKRTITIPAALAYGAQGVPGKVPANAALVFDVELLAVN